MGGRGASSASSKDGTTGPYWGDVYFTKKELETASEKVHRLRWEYLTEVEPRAKDDEEWVSIAGTSHLLYSDAHEARAIKYVLDNIENPTDKEIKHLEAYLDHLIEKSGMSRKKALKIPK